jgi:hypothetical protein
MASKRFRSPRFWLDIFLFLNLAGLAPDIYLAHSFNNFRRPEEYIPLYFSLTAPAALLIAILARELLGFVRLDRFLGQLIGWSAVAIGIVGTVLHLNDHFFQELTLDSLVYAAPFAAPLAYAGMGLLLIMNRMVAEDSAEWAQWVLMFALGGYVGNFVFSLTDHALNAFFHRTEWIPVISSALAIGFLLMPLMMNVSRTYLRICAAVMLLQGLVGLLGFYYHFVADWHGDAPSLFGNLVHGAPVLAPMLFADLMLLALLGLGTLARHLPTRTPAIQPG